MKPEIHETKNDINYINDNICNINNIGNNINYTNNINNINSNTNNNNIINNNYNINNNIINNLETKQHHHNTYKQICEKHKPTSTTHKHNHTNTKCTSYIDAGTRTCMETDNDNDTIRNEPTGNET
ncbi:hypothetical protein HELRODRAFT_167199 [Helobdella robusta]|uniref:Uncharacterized protein n=1 Tax=Helobdella robusta TaxID=6412 RepID=T1EZ49_HELRO|nr:hypothetical protein HELRODRAFT_167199 [Helobdella robusta]ESO10706.1 hypothetical protein HELRODRAFT_167199 [Helobdella robusta]